MARDLFFGSCHDELSKAAAAAAAAGCYGPLEMYIIISIRSNGLHHSLTFNITIATGESEEVGIAVSNDQECCRRRVLGNCQHLGRNRVVAGGGVGVVAGGVVGGVFRRIATANGARGGIFSHVSTFQTMSWPSPPVLATGGVGVVFFGFVAKVVRGVTDVTNAVWASKYP
jgi:hypothetical protein